MRGYTGCRASILWDNGRGGKTVSDTYSGAFAEIHIRREGTAIDLGA